MPSRRPKGTGSLRERPQGSGHWQIRAWAGTDAVTGKPRQLTETFVGSITGAHNRLKDMQRELEDGEHGGANATVQQLLDEFVAHSAARGRAPRTIHEAKRSIETTLKPLGELKLFDLTPRHIDELYRELREGTPKRKPLAPTSIRRHHAVLTAALAQGVKWGWLGKNPADRATLPEVALKPIEVVRVDDVRRFLNAAGERNPRYGMLFALLLATAARRGEVCALRWTDLSGSVEDGTAVIRIRRALYRAGNVRGEKAPKTNRERWVPIEPPLAGLLADWRERCERTAADNGVELAKDAFIVSVLPDGSRPVNPDTLSTVQGKLAGDLGVKLAGRNPFRHFGASEMGDGDSGVSARDAADILGHADVSMTLNRYTHSTKERQHRAAAVLARAIEQA